MKMKITIVTRHTATIELMEELIKNGTLKLKDSVSGNNAEKIEEIEFNIINHLENENSELGDVVIGILPIPKIIEILNQGKEFYLFSLNNVPQNMRGKELTLQDLKTLGFSFYKINKIDVEKII